MGDQMMRVVEIREFGGPEVLTPGTREIPEPGHGQVLIKVAYAGVNRPDAIQRSGNYPVPKGASDLPGLEGATYYYYEIPQNEVNDWLVETHFERFGTPPDFFTAGGMAAGIAIVEAIEAAGTYEDTEALIAAMEGMTWETPKGPMTFRPEDHQAMQSMYHFRIEVQDGVDWGVPVLVREIEAGDMDVPIRN